MAFATVPLRDLGYERDESLPSFASTPFGRRTFCSRCGTPLTIHVDHQADTIDFSIATLDAPAAVVPGFHIFYASRIPWAEPGDALPRHDRFRPGTRGLEGTEPPE